VLRERAAHHHTVGGEESKGLIYGGGETVADVDAVHADWLCGGAVAPPVVGEQRYAVSFIADYLLAESKLFVCISFLHNFWNVQSSAAAEVGEKLWIEVCCGVWDNCP
jgi:hypothetical protein